MKNEEQINNNTWVKIRAWNEVFYTRTYAQKLRLENSCWWKCCLVDKVQTKNNKNKHSS